MDTICIRYPGPILIVLSPPVHTCHLLCSLCTLSSPYLLHSCHSCHSCPGVLTILIILIGFLVVMVLAVEKDRVVLMYGCWGARIELQNTCRRQRVLWWRQTCRHMCLPGVLCRCSWRCWPWRLIESGSVNYLIYIY